MMSVPADTAKKTENKTEQKPGLDRSYGAIGISAVAAAARYHGIAKNPAYAPVALNSDLYSEDAAA